MSICSQTSWRLLRRSLRSSCQATRHSRRVHSVPLLKHDSRFKQQGVVNLLSARGYQIAWHEYQQLMVDRLNLITEGHAEANETPKALVLGHARDPQYAAVFNHASMAWNNHFFFDGLAASPTPETALADSSPLHASLLSTFGTMDHLKQTMIEMADTMFGPGFVWLVWARQLDASPTKDAWRILPTYLAGTPYPEAGFRQQAFDQNTAGSFGAHSRAGRQAAARAPGTAKLEPVLCVNTWQHVYLQDYGVAGKREYLDRWWDAIDWRQVETRAPPEAKGSRGRLASYQSFY